VFFMPWLHGAYEPATFRQAVNANEFLIYPVPKQIFASSVSKEILPAAARSR
jgi:hypothetical protein